MKRVLFSLALLLTAAAASGQKLRSGPMAGFSDFREVALWAQTDGPAEVQFVCWPLAEPERKTASATRQATEETGFTVEVPIAGLEPGTRYGYEIRVNGRRVKRPYLLEFQTQALWQHRTDPPAFRFAAGSCNYTNEPAFDRPGRPYGGGDSIFTKINEARPDFMLWLGDNVYLREVDWNSRSGIYHRYSHARALPELQPLLGRCHHYAIWDDHDYGPNDSDRGYVRKRDAWDAFRDFWANPTQGLDGDYRGITTQFAWADVEFFLLDDRWFRSPNNRRTGECTILGKRQLAWLIDALVSSRASFKVVCMGGQFLNPAEVYETYANVCPEERERLLRLLKKERIPGLLFMNGDRHITELSMLEQEDFYPLYDLTVSPLTSGVPPEKAEQEANSLRVQGTFVRERNFALIEVSGPLKDRVMTVNIMGADGGLRWTRQIRAQDLRPPKRKEPQD